ncbi:lasso peptide biosynthesis B2 protein [Streptomyces sioyaensis]|uniref:lasso peptide biosynthesis B2 protein n=1 Tax=Streptomyces sioyaensis TaxID=67364 RepID=UPI0033D11618
MPSRPPPTFVPSLTHSPRRALPPPAPSADAAGEGGGDDEHGGVLHHPHRNLPRTLSGNGGPRPGPGAAAAALPSHHPRRALGPAGRAPTAAQAQALVEAVRHTGRLWPVRAACLETSLGTVLAAVLLGRRLHWCLGVRFSPPPTEYHSWVELPDDGPVGEYTEAGWHHHTALTI